MRKARVKQGLTEAEAARLAGIDPGTLREARSFLTMEEALGPSQVV